MNENQNKDVATGPAQPISSQDLAGFVALLFWMHDPQAGAYTPYASFGQQVKGITDAVGRGDLPASKLITNIPAMYADKVIGPLIQSAQVSMGQMIQAIVQSGLWDVCKSVDMKQVSQIAALKD